MYRELIHSETILIIQKSADHLLSLEHRMERARIGHPETNTAQQTQLPPAKSQQRQQQQAAKNVQGQSLMVSTQTSIDQGVFSNSEPDTPNVNVTEVKLCPNDASTTNRQQKAPQNINECVSPNKCPLNQRSAQPSTKDSSTATGDYKEAKPPVLDPLTAKMHSEVERLTDHQRSLLQDTYLNVLEKNVPRHGCSVMLKLFSDYPQYKEIWPQFRQIPDSSLMSTTQLRKHAVVYMGGLRFIINSMDDDQKLSHALKNITQAHIKWKIHKSHIMHMLPSLLEVIRENGYIDNDIVNAWTTLFDVIANLIEVFRVRKVH